MEGEKMNIDHDLMLARARDSLYTENRSYAVSHNEVPFYMADFAIAETKALRERLERAEAVIRHYADLNHWLNADLSITTEGFYANEYDFERNGFDKAREYLDEFDAEDHGADLMPNRLKDTPASDNAKPSQRSQ
jgi:hypothetical protein